MITFIILSLLFISEWDYCCNTSQIRFGFYKISNVFLLSHFLFVIITDAVLSGAAISIVHIRVELMKTDRLSNLFSTAN